MQEAYCRSVCKSLLHTYSANARADVQSYTHAHAQTRQSSDALAQDVLHSQSHACQPARAHTSVYHATQEYVYKKHAIDVTVVHSLCPTKSRLQ